MAAEESRLLSYDRRVWHKKILPPHPCVVEGAIANTLFCIYCAYPLVCLASSLIPSAGAGGFTRDPICFLMIIIVSPLLAMLFRIWAINIARREALVWRSRRLLQLYAKTRCETIGGVHRRRG
jgi:hypothetical protein